MIEVFLCIIVVLGFIGLFIRDGRLFISLIFVGLILMGTVGYLMNIGLFMSCDFKEPYKEEAIRGIGVVVPPIGAVTGYVHIEDEDN